MKKYLLLLLIPMFFACGRAAEKKAQELQAKTDSLMGQTMQKDEAINEFIRSINDIQGTLDTIKQKENIINLTTDRGGELKLSAKEQIKNDIQTIYGLMQKNKETINALTKKLKSSNLKVTELNKMVERLNKDIADNGMDSRSLNICAAMNRNSVIGSHRRKKVAATPVLRATAMGDGCSRPFTPPPASLLVKV